MDFSVFDSKSASAFFKLREIENLRANEDSTKVTVCVLTGGMDSRQVPMLEKAIGTASLHFAKQNIFLDVESISHKNIFDDHHWNPTVVFNRAISADIHIIPTHIHQR